MNKIVSHYNQYLNKEGEEKVGWLQPHSQKLNFIELSQVFLDESRAVYFHNGEDFGYVNIKPGQPLPISNIDSIKYVGSVTSVLDVGCGTGDLLKFFASQNRMVDYEGWDINSNYIELAKKELNLGKFKNVDYKTYNMSNAYDYVFGSGLFSIREDEDDKKHYKIVSDGIFKLVRLCKKAVAINFVSTADHKELFRYDPIVIYNLCRVYGKVVLNCDFRDDAFSVFIYKSSGRIVDNLIGTDEENASWLLKSYLYEEVISRYKDCKGVEIETYVGIAYLNKGDTKSGKVYLDFAIDKGGYNSLTHVYRGFLAAKENDKVKARECFSEAVKRDPSDKESQKILNNLEEIG